MNANANRLQQLFQMQKRFLLPLLPLLLASCGDFATAEKRVIATSIYPLQYLASQIAGEHYEVINLTPPGSEPHDFELSVGAMKTMSTASAIFLNGLGMEHYADSLTSSLLKKTYILSAGLPLRQIENKDDPHVWLSIPNYKAMAEKVYECLLGLDASHALDYQTNYSGLLERLDDLDSRCKDIASRFDHKAIAVSHAAYGYLCDAYHIEQLYISGLSPDQEPSQKAIESLMDAIAEKGIDTIFFEELASPDIALSISSRTGARSETLNPLEGLSSSEREAGEDYCSIYLSNMEKIARAKP